MNLKFVYLGYWVKGSSKMDYKRRFNPLEVFINDKWACASNSKSNKINVDKRNKEKHSVPSYLTSEE